MADGKGKNEWKGFTKQAKIEVPWFYYEEGGTRHFVSRRQKRVTLQGLFQCPLARLVTGIRPPSSVRLAGPLAASAADWLGPWLLSPTAPASAAPKGRYNPGACSSQAPDLAFPFLPARNKHASHCGCRA